jgi:hypothetical protein
MAAEMSREGRDACENCQFFVPPQPRDEYYDPDKWDGRGTCRRHPPQWVPIPTHVYRASANHPPVYPNEWCGDHERAPVAAAIAEGRDG